MATKIEQGAPAREPLTKERILQAAVALADEGGVDSFSMRRVAQELGVVPMALYKHVANKDEMLDGMVDVVVGEIDPPLADADWKTAIRERVLSARRALLRHPWASKVIESRTNPTPTVIGYMDAMIGILRNGGFSIDLTHHAMHAMGSRMLGFSQELFDDSPEDPPAVQAIRCPVDGRDVPVHLRDGRGDQPRRRVGRRDGVRRSVRVRVRARPDARGARAATPKPRKGRSAT